MSVLPGDVNPLFNPLVDEIYSVKEAAEIMGVSQRTILRKIKDGTIPAMGGHGGMYLIFSEPFHEYLMEYEQSRKMFKKPGRKQKE